MVIENYGILLLAISYLLVAILGGVLCLSPTLRQQLTARCSALKQRIGQRIQSLLQQGAGASRQVHQQGGNQLQALLMLGGRQRWLLLAALCLLITPVLVVLILRSQIDTGGFDDSTAATNEVVAQLLNGEQLVPPPSLPPEAFEVKEVELIRPMLISASRDWQLLDEVFRQRLLLTFRLMEERHGYKMALLEGYRSPSRQNLLAGMGSSVTNAAAFQSYHQYGLAADCAFLRDGKLVISERDPWAMRGYQLYGEVAESVGLGWGGRWKMMDLGHVELRRSGVLGKPAPVY